MTLSTSSDIWFGPRHLQFILWLLLFLAELRPAHGQHDDLRGPFKEPPVVQKPIDKALIERQQAAQLALDKVTPQFIMALRDDDPFLAELYFLRAGSLGGSPPYDFLEADMYRRVDVTIKILTQLFENPIDEYTRSTITNWVTFHGWMKPDIFRPLVLEWYREMKASGLTMKSKSIQQFLSFWGHPEDEAILRELDEYHNSGKGSPMRMFRERLERLKNGDSTSLPYFPKFSADWPEFSKKRRAEAEAKNRAASEQPPPDNAKSVIPKPQTTVQPPATLPGSNLTPWIVLGSSALALVCLVLWFRRKNIG